MQNKYIQILLLFCTTVCERDCQNGGTYTRPGACACQQGWSGNSVVLVIVEIIALGYASKDGLETVWYW